MTYIHISQGITEISIKRNVKIQKEKWYLHDLENSYVDL